MRTAPPVLPDTEHAPTSHQSWFQRQGADGALVLRVAGALATIFVIVLGLSLLVLDRLYGIHGPRALVIAFAAASVLTVATGRFILGLAAVAGAIASKAVMPSGRSTPYEEQFSYQESRAARGDTAGALESYEAVIDQRPDAVLPRLRAAELYAKNDRDPHRAAELFRSVRDLPSASTRDALYAANRLVDLYDGALGDPGRALVELRRLADQHPGTRAAEQALRAIRTIKARRTTRSG